jgi:ABC-2 type transport system permease protein
VTPYSALLRCHEKAFVRDKMAVGFGFAFPLVFIVVFGLIFGGQTAPDGQRVINYIVPGVMSWGVASTAVFGVAYAVMHWRRNDVLRLIRMTPVRLTTVLGSRLVVSAVIAVVQAIIFVGVGLLPWFGVRVSALGVLLSLVILLLGVLSFFALGVVIGNFASSPEGVASVANCIMIPMAYLSGSFIPEYTWPSWLRGVSQALPLRYMNSGITATLGGGHFAAGDVLIPVAALIGFGVVFTLWGLKTFKWSSES